MRFVGMVFAAVLALASLAAPANAETWSAPDRTGDVRTFSLSDEPPPCGTVTVVKDPDNEKTDIVNLRVDHTTDAVVVEVALRDMSRRQKFYAEINIRTPGPDFTLDVDRPKPGARIRTFLAKEPTYVEPDECGYSAYAQVDLACEGLTAETDAPTATVRVSLPHTCLKDPRWVRVGAGVQNWSKPWSYDTWGPRSARPKNNPLVNPLGPRVAADATPPRLAP